MKPAHEFDYRDSAPANAAGLSGQFQFGPLLGGIGGLVKKLFRTGSTTYASVGQDEGDGYLQEDHAYAAEKRYRRKAMWMIIGLAVIVSLGTGWLVVSQSRTVCG